MYLVKDILNNKSFPNWIVSNPIFNEIKSFKKIFSYKGLKDCSEPLDTYLSERYLNQFIDDLKYTWSRTTPSLSLDPLVVATSKFFLNLSKSYLDIKKDKKISIYLSEDLTDTNGNVIFKKGSSFFSFLEKIVPVLDTLVEGRAGNIFNFESFKNFSRMNMPLGSTEVVFSTDPWDIATMSMRGIQTCQSWDGEHRRCLVGSILDPFVGIIFIATKNSSTKYGSKMLYRSVVRFVLEKREDGSNVPAFFLDDVYPQAYPEIVDLFQKFLFKKTNIDILCGDPVGNGWDLYFPSNIIRDKLNYFSENKKWASPLSYDRSIASYQNYIIEEKNNNSDLLRLRIIDDFFNKINENSISSEIEVSSFSSNKINILLALKSKNYQAHSIIKISLSRLKNILVRDIKLQNIDNLDYYKSKLLFDYINKKTSILRSISNQVCEWNSFLSLKKPNLFSKEDYVVLMQQITRRADIAVKAELKSLLLSRWS